MGEIILIIIAIVICTALPMYSKIHFEEKYNINVLMPAPVVLNFVALLLVLVVSLKEMEITWAIIIAIIVYFFSCIYVFSKIKNTCSKGMDVVLAIASNALLPIGVVLIVIITLVVIYAGSSGKRKKK